MTFSVESLTSELKAEAFRLGFTAAGVCPAVTPRGWHRLAEWLAAGYAGEMSYLATRAAAYEHPGHVLDGARSLLVLAMNYRTAEPTAPVPGEGRVSRYAWGSDYHDLMRERLHALADWFRARLPASRTRGVVDTAPLLEREFAQLAGLGWIGKNTLLLNRQAGSWFFLAVLLTDAELAYDEPHAADHCGTCRACLDACPTDAFVQPYVLDARRCLSYLTIELRNPIETSLRSELGDWLFGCDVCQEVCPWNQRAPLSQEAAFEPRAETNPMALAGLFDLDDEAFRARFRQTPLWRSQRRGLLRNAALVLGNSRDAAAVGALVKGLDDSEALVRGACAWALGRVGGDRASRALRQRAAIERDQHVRDEIEAVLDALV